MAIIKNKLRSPKVPNPQTDDDYDIYHPETEISQVVGGVAKVNGEEPDDSQEVTITLAKTVNGESGDVNVTLSPDYPLKVSADEHLKDFIKVGSGTFNSLSGYGINMQIGAGASMVLGAGESVNDSGLISSNDENLYLLADDTVNIYSNCDTFANRKEFKFTPDGRFLLPSGIEIW